MARGDLKFFAAGVRNMGVFTNSINLATDAIKIGFIGPGVTVSIALADPRWGAGGSTNLAAQEVATSTGYITGGVTMTSVTWIQTGTTVALSAANFTVAQDLTGFTTAFWGIGYDNTTANKYALFYIDLGGPIGISAGAVTITFGGGQIGTAVSS